MHYSIRLTGIPGKTGGIEYVYVEKYSNEARTLYSILKDGLSHEVTLLVYCKNEMTERFYSRRGVFSVSVLYIDKVIAIDGVIQ